MFFRFLTLSLLFFSLNISAQGFSPSMELILRQTLAANGHLTHQMHHEFWDEIRKSVPAEEISSIKKVLNINYLNMHEYQKEIWGSAKISYENERVVKTQRLIELDEELPLVFEKSLYFPKGSLKYQEAMLTYEKGRKITAENTRRLLEAAAARNSFTSAQGQLIPLDMGMINTVLENLISSTSRLENLFDENWPKNQIN